MSRQLTDEFYTDNPRYRGIDLPDDWLDSLYNTHPHYFHEAKQIVEKAPGGTRRLGTSNSEGGTSSAKRIKIDEHHDREPQQGPSPVQEQRDYNPAEVPDDIQDNTVESSQSQSQPISVNSSSSGATQSSVISSSSDITEDIPMDLPGTGKPQGDNGSPGGDEYYLPVQRTNFGTRTSTYSKTFQVVSECFVSTLLLTGTAPDQQIFVTSELLEIPWHLPAMYMTPSEFSNLQPGARASSMCCKVTFRGATVKFETNASSTQIATLNTIQTLRAAVGLNKTGWGNNFFYDAISPTDPMVPQSLIPSNYIAAGGRAQDLTSELYGSATRDGTPGAYNTGNFWIGRNYWCESSPFPVTPATIGWPTSRTQKCSTWDAKTMVDKEIINACYKPKVAPLTQPLKHFRATLNPDPSTGSFGVNVGAALVNQRVCNVSAPSGVTTVTETTTAPNQTMPTFGILTPIEKSQQIKVGPWGQIHPEIQPSINVGVQAMPQLGSINYIGGTYSQMVQSSAYYDVTLTMDVHELDPTHYNYLPVPNVPAGSEMFATAAPIPDQVFTSTYAGLWPNDV